MPTFHEKFFVITGAPCSGKTTLLRCLEDRNFTIMAEAGRSIIQDQTAIGGNALPWQDRHTYAELMLNWDIRSWREAPSRSRPVLFDRGIPDIIAYLEVNNLPVPAHLVTAAQQFRYHRTVFIAPYWPEIFEQDAQRKQSREEAEATGEAIARAYERLGYALLPLPKASLDERIEFILAHVGNLKKDRPGVFP